MTTHTHTDTDNPFQDPITAESLAPGANKSTLELGRDRSLTIGNEALIVLDAGLLQQKKETWPAWCGITPSRRSLPTRAIPFYHILWAELGDFELSIQYVHPVSKRVVRPASIIYPVEKSDRAEVLCWIALLLERAYGVSQREKRIKVLINPFGGRSKAQKWYQRDIEPLFRAAKCHCDVEKTKYRGHAAEIAEKLDIDNYDVIAACSGDGLPHEVFNGLGKKRDAAKALRKIAVVQLPCGSGNAMSWNLNGTDSPSLAALAIIKGLRTPLDLVSVTQGSKRTLSFLSQAVGLVAEADLGTEHMRWMGSQRFTYGVLVGVFGKTLWPWDVALKVVDDDKTSIREKYREQLAGTKCLDEALQYRNRLQSSTTAISPPGSIANDPHDYGLPSLCFGTALDPLPPDWTTFSYDNLGSFYAGNMAYMSSNTNFFQAAQPCDGCLDLVCTDGDISRWASIKMLLAVGRNKLYDMPTVRYRKVEAFRISPKLKSGYVSVDGESVPFQTFQVEVHRGLGTVLSKSGTRYEAPPLN